MNIKEKQNIALAYKKDRNSTRDELIAILKEYIEKPVPNDEDFRIFCAYVSTGANKWNDDEIKSLLSSLDSSVEEKNSHKEMNTIYSEQDIFNKFNDINSTYGVVFVNNVIEFIKKHHNFKLACDVLECFNSKRKVQEIRECEMHFLYKMQEIIKNSIKPQRFLVVLYKSGNPEWKNFTNDLFDKYVKLAKQAGFNVKEDL